MGVHGLTTYLRENRRLLSKSYVLSHQSPPPGPISIVVDGWSFIYAVHHNSNHPWVYGGEYEDFTRLVFLIVQNWIRIGFSVHFVFDGAYPELKFPTLVSRLGQSVIQPSLLFFRTSPISRNSARFLHETRIIPPFSYSVCIHALQSLLESTDSLQIHFADEEGDPYAVELAGRIGGYVVGNDSDFVVLNTDGYLGYIPLDEMSWTAAIPDIPITDEDKDDDFQPVRKGKPKVIRDPRLGRGIIPPDTDTDLSLSFTAYSPTTLASHLKVPVTLLPLLGALVGNDFTTSQELNNRSVQSMFFERQLTLTQRISRVASTIQAVISPSYQKRRQKHQLGSVMDLIDRTVNALLIRFGTTLGTGEVDKIIDQIVEATLQYAIPKYDGEIVGLDSLWPTDVCALHQPDACPILSMVSRFVMAEDQAADDKITLRSHYLNAYRTGNLDPHILDILSTATFWPRTFLENPDLETVNRSIGRPIRLWIYSILDDGIGLPEFEGDIDVANSTADASSIEDEDELIDVVESDDEENAQDLLAPLKGALERLHPGAETSTPLVSALINKPKKIVEYIRRGTRVASEAVTVNPLSELLHTLSHPAIVMESKPLASNSPANKFTILLAVLHSDYPSIRALSPPHLTAVLALRWVVRTLHLRAEETGSRERDLERWSMREAHCFLASLSPLPPTTPASNFPQVLDRHAQLMAQVASAIQSIEFLSQVLMITDLVAPVAHITSGRRFHSFLTESSPTVDVDIPDTLRIAIESGLGDFYAEERKKKAKKSKSNSQRVASRNPKSASVFQLLGNVGVEA
ncbi:hypothetical protein BD779DRAFT_1437600 [Infundibulicybe gibba]|nr:hypothetical protein BD779DRAFT_1437600 [Infundibulicybe gibba]